MAAQDGKKFRLARVLELREQQVTACRDQLEKCQADLTAWREHRDAVVQQQQAAGLRPGADTGVVAAADLQLREQGRRWYEQELARLAGEIQKRERAVENARAELWQAEQRRQRLERLRERFDEQQKRWAKREERKRLNRWNSFQSGAGG